ncbi:DUF2577 domain-containing protein [Clostridium tyrobutyricum]|uniref:DUF2577 domain-containing protein n=1 Tax=Clostridium tyrobutyricum TaxID=1519 RepID=UPI001C380D85|nr:DUF2577 domain-containing protein [Clostridium tyrobutyricum]MBV4417668.1 DUF2577 domain-containing protein [Clostridium tyrobutyricum]
MDNSRWAQEFAKKFKERDNPKQIGHVIGNVVKVNPITVSVLDGKGLFTDGDNLIIGDNAKGYKETVNITIDGTTKQAIINHDGLIINDKVICQFTNNNQKLVVLNRVS